MSALDWQLTATTIYCEAVCDEATLLVYKDGSARCVACKKYLQKGVNSPRSGLKCDGPECRRLIEYRDQLLREETAG